LLLQLQLGELMLKDLKLLLELEVLADRGGASAGLRQ